MIAVTNIGWNTIQKYLSLKQRLNSFGLELGKANHWHVDQDCLAVHPLGEHGAPCFSRDAELFVGTLGEVEHWFKGYETAYKYLIMIDATSDKKIRKCEQSIENQNLLKLLKQN